MKLASYHNGRRDGQLMLVSKDLTKTVAVPAIAHTMQQLLDAWDLLYPQLNELYEALNAGQMDNAVDFDEARCLSPLPRAYQWADGSAYVNHVELVRKARGAEMPASFWTDPLVYQGGSDSLSPLKRIFKWPAKNTVSISNQKSLLLLMMLPWVLTVKMQLSTSNY